MTIENKNPKLIRILDKDSLKFQCKICSQIWFARILPGGEIKWECPQGCIADCKKRQSKRLENEKQ